MIYQGLINLASLLFEEFCKVYGNAISKDVVVEFLSKVDDLREVNEKYIGYLYDYVVDFNLIGCKQ